MKNVSKILVLVLVLTVLLTACGPKKADKLTIGTSADFPPFEFVDENGDFAGFDVDLINKLSEVMGVEVEIVDMPFDSLVASVQEGKIDMSVAAFNYSEERDEVVDFTDFYYYAMDGFMVAEDFAAEITAPEDIAGLIVGCQTGSTQNAYIQENLVDTGLLPAENFFTYERVDQAALDVKAGRIDVLMAEAAVLGSFEKEMGGLKIAYTAEMSSGPMAMIIPEGDTELQTKLNAAINELLDSGYVDELAAKWMK
jgi:polar amino acid transport system substrate-binding protein